MVGKNYYKVLNLAENASLKEVKKRYKQLAKKYHPDVNKEKNAHKKFLKIKEAYEKIINPEEAEIKLKRGPKPKSKYDKYREQAHKAYTKKQKRKKEEIQAFYISLRKGWRRNWVYLNSTLGIIFSFFLLLDNQLEPENKKTKVNVVDHTVYQSYNGHLVQRVETENGQFIYLADYHNISALNTYPEIVIKETRIFNYPVSVVHTLPHKRVTIPVHFTFMWALALVLVFFLSPLVVLFFRKNNAWFVFFHYSTLLVSSGILFYFIFFKNSIVSIFYFLFS